MARSSSCDRDCSNSYRDSAVSVASCGGGTQQLLRSGGTETAWQRRNGQQKRMQERRENERSRYFLGAGSARRHALAQKKRYSDDAVTRRAVPAHDEGI